MKQNEAPLVGEALLKEVNRLIRLARSYWDAHNNLACRTHREKAMALYNALSEEQKARVPEVLRTWLRYRSEKYFGDHRTPQGGGKAKSKSRKAGSGTLPAKKAKPVD